GRKLDDLPLSSVRLTGLAREGSFLYTMDSGDVLQVIDISGVTMRRRGSLSLPLGGGNLVVGNGVAYADIVPFIPPAGTTVVGGYLTADVSDPDHLKVLGNLTSTSLLGQAIAVNGSGLAL